MFHFIPVLIQNSPQLGAKLWDRAGFAYDHNVQTPQAPAIMSEALAHQTFQAVAFHRSAGTAGRNHQSESGLTVGIGTCQHRKSI